MKMSRKLAFLGASLFSVASLSGCQKDNSLIYVYEKNSCISTGSFAVGGYKKLTTYRHRHYGDTPYCNLKELFNTGIVLPNIKLNYSGDGVFNVVQENNSGLTTVTKQVMTLDTENDILTVQNFDLLSKVLQPNENNGVLFEQCQAIDDNVHLVHTSTHSIQIGEPVVETYNLREYSIDMVEINKKCYLPTQFILDFMCRNIAATFAYNGLDFIAPGNFGMANYGAYCSFYSSKGRFYFEEKLMSSSKTVDSEKYRFVHDDFGFQPDERRYLVFSFLKNGYGIVTHLPSPTSPTDNAVAEYTLNWTKKDIGIIVTMSRNYSPVATFKLALKTTNLEKVTRTTSTVHFAYNYLRFQFNEIYGLMDELHTRFEVNNVDELIQLSGLREQLMSTNSYVYEQAITKFIETYVDDGHTYLYQKPVFSRFSGPTQLELSTSNLGDRSKALADKRDKEYKITRANKLENGGENFTPDFRWDYNGQGLYIKNKTAVIRFDGFLHDYSFIHRGQPYNFNNPGNEFDTLPPGRYVASCVRGMDMCFNELATNHPEVKNVVIDLSCNTGGQIITLPYLCAFFSNDPTLIQYDRVLKVVREYHYEVDLNRDGIYGGEDDTYVNKFDNIAILTSDLSFSCGSALPSMAKIAGIKTIGAKSAGGACPPTALTDGCGTVFSTSAPMQISYYIGDVLVNDDAGVNPDVELNEADWFNFKAIDDIFSSPNP